MDIEMKEPAWTKKDFIAYLLLYAAHADFVEKEEEKKLIKKKVGKEEYNHIHEEFEEDSDYQRVQKIHTYVSDHSLSNEELDNILDSIKKLFKADGDFKAPEKSIYFGLRKLLQDQG